MSEQYWFHKKWGLYDKSLQDRIIALESLVGQLQDRIENLEDENVSTTNELYRLENSLDARIDILTAERFIKEDV